MNNKELFKSIVKTTITRKGIDRLMEYLEKTDFYIAPASTRFHDSCEGGLLQHSLNVYFQFLRLPHLELGLTAETIAIITLFHDFCKVGYYKTEMRNTKDENGKWIQVPYYIVEDSFPLGHGEKSLVMIREFIDLSADEMLAIRWHMGGFVSKEEYATLGKAYNTCPLAVYLHTADMWATYLGGVN